MPGFSHQYGPLALVTGAAEGLGEAFAAELAQRGVNLMLVDVNAAGLRRVADRLDRKVVVDTFVCDLAEPDAVERIAAATVTPPGLVVSNAAIAPMGVLHLTPADALLRSIDVNVRTPILLARRFLPDMVRRGRGGLVLLASMAGFHGSPGLAAYAASRAYNRALGESLWGELRPHGVDVLALAPGPTDTPGFRRSRPTPGRGPRVAPAAEVAREALDALASPRRGPVLVPGVGNRLSSALLDRVLPRATAARVVHLGLSRLYGERLRGAPRE